MKIKPQQGWGITYVNSPQVAIHSIRATRREAIADWVGKDGIDWTWDRWREQGCRAVKVEVTQQEQTQ
jgi:hypothetical protein